MAHLEPLRSHFLGHVHGRNHCGQESVAETDEIRPKQGSLHWGNIMKYQLHEQTQHLAADPKQDIELKTQWLDVIRPYSIASLTS